VVLTSWVVLCTALGLLSITLVQPDAAYRALVKPDWMPPDAVLPLAWLVLYLLMGIAAARITRSRHPDASIALSYFVVQLALNAAWLPALFRSQSQMVALVAGITLWLASAATLWLFRQIDRRAAWLYVPVFIWSTAMVGIAVAIWRLNS
jgi:tryptophan-rich sensory protein